MASPTPMTRQNAEDAADHFRQMFAQIKREIQTFMVGQERVIDDVLNAVICGGHVLLEGVPGLGKTALVHTLASTLDLSFKRIQFTPDLLPADVVGSNILAEADGKKVFEFQPGPVFCHAQIPDYSLNDAFSPGGRAQVFDSVRKG